MNELQRRTIVYIDGYNWYHAIFKYHPEWKWLNIQKFFEALRPREEVIAVNMFSALVGCDGIPGDGRERQVRYFEALKTLPKVRIILGFFQGREVRCKASCKEIYVVPEEKKTDVNIVVEMLSDAIAGNCESMCVVTGDSDIQPAVEWITKNRPTIGITVYVPALPVQQATRRTDYYRTKNLPVTCEFLPLGNIKDHQLPNAVKLKEGKLSIKPHVWNLPATTAPGATMVP